MHPLGEGDSMTTAQQLEEKAMALAQEGTDTNAAVSELLECSGQKRVSVVVARHHFLEVLEQNASDTVAVRAVELLDEALVRGDWHIEPDED
jgi:hypothetical protein